MNKQPEKTVGCIVMASGKGERFGENKLLARLAGREMLLYVTDAVRTAAFSEILVVTRHPEVREIVRDAYGPADGCPPVRCVLYPGGPQSETVKRGLSEMLSYDACLFAAGPAPAPAGKCLPHGGDVQETIRAGERAGSCLPPFL